MLDPRKLEVLVSVIESGSLTAAADRLSFSPSAVSQTIRKLERDAGVPLVQRRHRGMVATEAGHVLANHARKVLKQLDAAQADLSELAHGERGTLVVGTFPSLASSFLPEVIRKFKSQFPSVQLSLRSSRIGTLVDELERGRLHLCFLWDYPWRQFQSPEIRCEFVFSEPSVVLVSKSHPLADKESVRIEDLGHDPWIVRANHHPVVEVLERTAAAARFTPHISLEANDYQETQAMVSVGMGIALVPLSAVTLQHPEVRVLSLQGGLPERRIMLAQRAEHAPAPAEVAFRRLTFEVV